ncbi:MAG: alcohol dehydrogenase catalytic domain-containing protein [Chloroflexi bacterium]|nr:alcohol dehydrogenase catalytic domain-containing protein [Chloroflexota bacterium]
MKTAVLYGGHDIRVEEWPEPAAGRDEVVVRIRAAGICGSDLRHYRGERPDAEYPIRAGHELSGEVVGLGPGVTTLDLGQRVGVEPLHLLGCGVCIQCRRGAYHVCARRGLRDQHAVHSSGFSELDVAPVENVYPLPDSVSFEAAALLDVYAVAVHGVHRLAPRPFETVVVVGTGAVGLTQGQVARALGARQVVLVGRRSEPLRTARECGAADAVIDTSTDDPVQAIQDLTDGAGADVVFESSGGRGAIQLCVDLAGFGGRIGVVGLYAVPESIDASSAMRKELDVMWVNSYSTWDGRREYAMALDLLAAGRVQAGSLVTHRVSLDGIADGFSSADAKARSGALKVMVRP